jgi:hypothetical protein
VKDESSIENYNPQFTVYKPAVKRAEPAMQIIIPSPRVMNNTINNVTPIRKNMFEGDIERSIEMKGPLN